MNRPTTLHTIILYRTFLICLFLVLAHGVTGSESRPVAAQAAVNYSGVNHEAEETGVSIPNATVGEGNDFATQVLGDPWDMTQYSDVSQYMNNAGQLYLMDNIRTDNGLFAAQSMDRGDGGGDPYIFPLFPGYLRTVMAGKVGHRYPINSGQYRCFYAAMRVDSTISISAPDKWSVYWFEDENLNTAPALWGFGADYLHEGLEQPIWQLYQMDLPNPPLYLDDRVRWDGSALWRGLRIDPTDQSGVDFVIDWIRLTDCTAKPSTVSWTPNRTITSLWIQPQGTSRYIRVATDVVGERGTYTLDVQGLQAGTYTVGLGTETDCCITESPDTLTVNAAPRVSFYQPSFTSGQDYATTGGNEWDFADGSDVAEVRNASGGVSNGALNLTTPAGPLPAGVDAQFDLAMNGPLDTGFYRYLTFRMNTEWDVNWQDPVSGMMVRLVWTIDSLTAQPGFECHLVSQDIPVDIGWQTYSIDMYDFFDGSAEDSFPTGSPHCPDRTHPPEEPPQNVSANAAHWLNQGPVIRLRFDPNENISCVFGEEAGREHIPCSDYRQNIDWITITAMDQIPRGQPYEMVLDLSEQMAAGDFTFFYTTNPAQPRQNPLRLATGGSSTEPAGPNRLYLPLVHAFGSSGNGAQAQDPDFPSTAHTAQWNTSDVAPGEYYICVEADDGLNTTIFCSEAPVKVVAA